MDVDQRLEQQGITLPAPHPAVANYIMAARTGSLLFLAGHGSFIDGKPAHTGKLGSDLSTEQGRVAAEVVTLNLLATLKGELGELSRVTRVVKVVVFVNSTPDFIEQHLVANGATDLLERAFGNSRKIGPLSRRSDRPSPELRRGDRSRHRNPRLTARGGARPRPRGPGEEGPRRSTDWTTANNHVRQTFPKPRSPLRRTRGPAVPGRRRPATGMMHQTGLMYSGRVATDLPPVDATPPAFLRLAGDPLRWRLLSELARSDRRVSELTGLVGEPQNSVSYHLGRLRGGGLVSMRRSSADGRDSYYRIELARCGQLLAATGAALHPGLGGAPTPAARHRAAPVRVLFLCTGNSARSQIAEALLAHAAGGRVEVASAGSQPKPLHPNAVRVMRTYGIDVTGARSKHLHELAGRRFDYVITLCDKVREVCPEFPGHPESIHWSIPDPAAAGTGRAGYPAFRAVAADLHSRIGFLVQVIAPPATAAKGDLP